ncbi:MAG: hypothetical protein GY711_32990 [bacterium]|nr:hypothetical protein [bacterium]
MKSDVPLARLLLADSAREPTDWRLLLLLEQPADRSAPDPEGSARARGPRRPARRPRGRAIFTGRRRVQSPWPLAGHVESQMKESTEREGLVDDQTLVDEQEE